MFAVKKKGWNIIIIIIAQPNYLILLVFLWNAFLFY